MHDSRRTYNDLKLANIMVNYKDIQNVEFQNLRTTLIDFGFSHKFVDQNGNHVSNNATVEKFQGNLLFSSLDQLNFKVTSRKDDMISLTYLLMFLLNDNEMPLQPDSKVMKKQHQLIKRYKLMIQYKTKVSLATMVNAIQFFPKIQPANVSHVKTHEISEIEELQNLFRDSIIQFVQTVEILNFTEKPNYNYLRELLIQCQQTKLEIDSLMTESTVKPRDLGEDKLDASMFDVSCSRIDLFTVNAPYETIKFTIKKPPMINSFNKS